MHKKILDDINTVFLANCCLQHAAVFTGYFHSVPVGDIGCLCLSHVLSFPVLFKIRLVAIESEGSFAEELVSI